MCFGPFKRICHWGPLTALAIIKIVSYSMIRCSNMVFPPVDSLFGLVNLVIFMSLSCMTLYNFLSAMYEGPGYIPLQWKPEHPEEKEYLQYCSVCEGYKAPRSHHCRKCNRCVMKMDHHCPWINNCVGHFNHAHFTIFLFCSACGCLQAGIIMSITLYKALHRSWYSYHTNRPIQFSLGSLSLTLFAIGLSVGVVISVGLLFYLQMKSILRNRTGIEDWILVKANIRRPENEPFLYPYDLGTWENIWQVFSSNYKNLGDGIIWPVVDGCHQYSLTIEQKEQKIEKKMRTIIYIVEKSYSGRWFPLIHGWRVFTHPPLSDEPRIPLSPSDKINVTRWRKYWLFGEKVTNDVPGERIRGWFPRCCVMELAENDLDFNEFKKFQ